MYEEQIIRILLDVGARGIGVKKLAKHVYNLSCTLFDQPDFVEVYNKVQYYIYSRARMPNSFIESTGQWGRYRIKARSAARVREMLSKSVSDSEEEKSGDDTHTPDLSLSLFPDL